VRSINVNYSNERSFLLLLGPLGISKTLAFEILDLRVNAALLGGRLVDFLDENEVNFTSELNASGDDLDLKGVECPHFLLPVDYGYLLVRVNLDTLTLGLREEAFNSEGFDHDIDSSFGESHDHGFLDDPPLLLSDDVLEVEIGVELGGGGTCEPGISVLPVHLITLSSHLEFVCHVIGQ
jgi:hypothetical protein